MLEFVIDLWKNTEGNVHNLSLKTAKELRSTFEYRLYLATFIVIIIALIATLTTPLIFPEHYLYIVCSILLLLLILTVLLGIIDTKNRKHRITKLQAMKLSFYANLDKEFRKFDLLDQGQFDEFLDSANKELDGIKQRRQNTLAWITLVVPILMGFSSLIISTVVMPSTSSEDTLIYILAASLIALATVFLLWIILTPTLSPRERTLTYFSNDLSEFKMLGMDKKRNRANLRQHFSLEE